MNISSCEWKESPKNMGNKLHSICSYMAMFPPSLPNYFIKKYSNEGEVVLDPFSGRGTTVLEACLMNRKGIGNDRNPLAFVLTKAKSNVPQIGRILSRISQLEKKFNLSSMETKGEPPEIKMIFNDFTLKQLTFLKNNLKWRSSNVDAFITSMVLGTLHGSSIGFMSLSMPNTFSMSPNYIKNYVEKHGLEKPRREVFEILRNKLKRCYQRPSILGRAHNQDVRKMTKIRDSSVDLVVTSPPYTRVIRYGQFNWIRLWFLNENGKETDKKLFFTQSLDKYCNFMTETLNEIKRVLKPNAKAVLVIGDVKDREGDKIENLAKVIWEKCAQPLGFDIVEPICADVISDDTKVSKIWGKKRGNATKTDRILVLEKIT